MSEHLSDTPYESDGHEDRVEFEDSVNTENLRSAFTALYHESLREIEAKQTQLRRIADRYPDAVDTDGYKREAAGITGRRDIVAAIGAVLMSGNQQNVDLDIENLMRSDERDVADESSDTEPPIQ